VWERLRSETELRQQTNLLATTTDHAAEGLFLMDQEGRITFVNRAAEQMLGWRRGEMEGRVLYNLLQRDKRGGNPPAGGGTSLRCGVTRGKVLRGHEDALLHKDGSTVDVSCSSAPIMADGKADGAVLVAYDITARKQAERALAESETRRRESEARVRLLADFSPAIVWFGHPDGTLSYLNHARYEYTGLTPEQSLPDGWQTVMHPDDAATLLAAWEKARR
jgi:PAS domain S-box-containing protein